ncbi:MAG: MucBP domain-containing protein [Lactococcus raffinolactis]
MKFKTGVALILSGTTLGLGARVMTIGVVADTQEEKAPTFSPTSVTSRTVTVSGDDFLNYFQRNGSAVHFNYDLTDHIQTLTPNQKHQSGNVTLKTKVDMSQDFTFNGLINLGNKSSRMGGADGVGFLFHPGNTDVVGRDGGAAGIGGVQGAFGFKLDTYYNANHETSFNPDPSEFASGQSYGAFVDGTTSVAQTLEDGAQPIAQPSYDIFKPFKMFYNGTSKIMTVTYDGQTWQQDVSSLIGNNSSMSFSISASTGENYNLQQLQITNFQYTVAQGTVVANYIDENQNQLKTPVTTNGDIDTIYSTNQASIPGYTFKEVMGAAPTGTYQANVQNINYVYTRKQGLATITYIDDTTGQALNQKEITGATGEEATYDLVSDTYPMTGVVYDQDDLVKHYEVHLSHKTTAKSDIKVVNETVHYLFKNGDKAAEDYLAVPLRFIRPVVTDQVTGDHINGNWSAVGDTTFATIISPRIKDEIPDQPEIQAISNVTGDVADIVKTVIYTAVEKPKTTPINYGKDTPPNHSSKLAPVVSSNNKKELPDTGAKNGMSETIFGTIVLLVTFGMTILRKKHQ